MRRYHVISKESIVPTKVGKVNDGRSEERGKGISSLSLAQKLPPIIPADLPR
jgi:hypothetical protein